MGTWEICALQSEIIRNEGEPENRMLRSFLKINPFKVQRRTLGKIMHPVSQKHFIIIEPFPWTLEFLNEAKPSQNGTSTSLGGR